jgi:hypothetical protein
MSIEENKALARRWAEGFNKQDWAGIAEITAPTLSSMVLHRASRLTSRATNN